MGSLETLGGLGVYFDDFRFFSIFGDSDPHFGLGQNAKNGIFGTFRRFWPGGGAEKKCILAEKKIRKIMKKFFFSEIGRTG